MTILQQLGGNRFLVMTGATNLTSSENSLTFKLPRNPKKVTHVRIELINDLYNVSFLDCRMTRTRLIQDTLKKIDGVYAENLQNVFTSGTGFDTHF